MNSLYFVFSVIVLVSIIANLAQGWTQLCPQSHLNELCKCSPGEQCCFCPKPKARISHGHVAEGLMEMISPPSESGNPCASLVIPNGCTVGGTCPSCNGIRREFTSDVCVDEPSCPRVGLTRTICSTFADIRARCPLSCGDCCHDDEECRGLPLNDQLCSSFSHIRKKCRSTCGTCDIEKNMDKAEAACVSNGGIVKNGMPPTTGAYPPKLRTSEKKYCWKEGLYTQPEASAFCAKLSGRLPVLHTNKDNEDLGNAAGSLHSIWLGLVRSPKCKSNINSCFQWEDEAALGPLANWYSGKWLEPNNMGGYQNCVYMNWPDKAWLDGDCDDKRNVLCELHI